MALDESAILYLPYACKYLRAKKSYKKFREGNSMKITGAEEISAFYQDTISRASG